MEKVSKNDFLNNVQGIIDQMKSQVDAYASEVFENANAAKEAESAACCFENITNKNGINLKESIKNIASSEASSNAKLMETIEQYAGALNSGLYEERLYESFLTNISKFDYLLPVEKEIKRINEAVEKNFKPIEITKILEEMTTTPSYYIIPMIEEDACRYVKNPTDINRVQFRAILCSFASDPYCNLMLNALEHKNDVYAKSISEKAMTINDKIKFVRQDANVTNIYSPVQYIKENESVFNANGQFYVKKGNTLAKLPDEYLNQLSEKFLAMCQLVNDPHVTIFEDHIVLTGRDKVASIYENYIDINGQRENPENLRNIEEMSLKYDFDNNFFITASCLHENFDNIAVINFGKHVALNSDGGVNIDMFRMGDNIYVNAVNENFMKATFYSNVNPIQCRNLINKHMGINVASLFEDLIPSQEKILVKLNETKNEYEESIEQYEASLQKLNDAKKECTSEDNEKKLDDAIKSTETKLKELKDEYKDWQKKAKDATEVEDPGEKKNDKPAEETDNTADDNTDVEKANEPIKPEDVDNVKGDLMQPIGTEDAAVDNGTISDDEFDGFLADENAEGENTDNVPAMTDEIPAIDNTAETGENPDVIDIPEEGEPVEGFTEMPNDEIPTEEPAEEMPELPADDKNTIETEETDGVDFNDMDFDELENSSAENTVANDNYVTPELEAEGYKIANITFDQNVKTGELFKTGNILVVTPMIDGTGKMFADAQSYNFYIDETSHMPIVNTPGCPVALYNAMVNAILTDPGFEKADKDGAAMLDKDANEPDNDQIWYDADMIDNVSDEIEKEDEDPYFNVVEDDKNNTLTISPKENDNTPIAEPVDNETFDNIPSSADNMDNMDDDKILSDIFADYKAENTESEKPSLSDEPGIPAVDAIPTYKEGNTDIELPAATTDNTNIPEISSEEAENPEMLDNATDNNEDNIDFDREMTDIVNDNKPVLSDEEADAALDKLDRENKLTEAAISKAALSKLYTENKLNEGKESSFEKFYAARNCDRPDIIAINESKQTVKRNNGRR